jgi:hypothetical protein
MLFTNAPEFRVVQQQVGELSALLHKVDFGQAGYAFVEVVNAQELAQDQARIVKAECLIEIAKEQILFSGLCHMFCVFGVLPGDLEGRTRP